MSTTKKSACGSGQRSKKGLGLPKRILLFTIHINNDMNINIHIDINMNIDITPLNIDTKSIDVSVYFNDL